MTRFWCELAWLGGDQAEPGVVLTVDDDRISAVETGVSDVLTEWIRLDGLTLPGLANTHSHAFHRALRGHTQGGTGSFWTWRAEMYDIADRLDPDSYHRLARATFAEMVQAGICLAGEFHYVHHQPDGTPYDEPNAMGEAVMTAAADAGLRLTLLDTCYLHGGLGPDGYEPVEDGQRRFSDGSATSWVDRVEQLAESPLVHIGAAVHSVRAVDPAAVAEVRRWSERSDAPVHAHLSEQPAENDQCRAVFGMTPTQLLADAGIVTDRLTAVHATHLTDSDIDLIGGARAGACFCPTTERDLADGIGPGRALVDAGAVLSVGSDSHAVIDPFEETRAVELDERLTSRTRGNHPTRELLTMVTRNGYRSLGWADGGHLAPGGIADFTTIALDSVRTAGSTAGSALATTAFAATAADVHHVVIGGQVVVRDGAHVAIDVPTELAVSIGEVHR